MQQSLKINNDIFQIQKQNLEFDLDSQVYLGTNSQTNEEVTIRFCSIDQAELQILQNIHKSKKENLIEIKHIELRKENQQIIVMEPIIENFYSFMTGNEIKTLSKEQKNILFYQMVLSVKDLHELGYIHRDIKPENFCLIKNNSSSEITVKLFNFSLSKYNSDRIKTLNVGSPLYVAPDVIKQADYGFSIDLWSLGCVWFELLTGDTFFKGTQAELLQNIHTISQQDIQNRINKNQSLNFYEQSLISQLLQIESKKRCQICDLEKFFFTKLRDEVLNYYISKGYEKIREFEQLNNVKPQVVENLNQQFQQSKSIFLFIKRQINNQLIQNQIDIQNIKQIEQLPQVVQELYLLIIEKQKNQQIQTSLKQESDQKINLVQSFQFQPPQFLQFK